MSDNAQDVEHMRLTDKFKSAIEHAIPHLPHELQDQFRKLLEPKSLAIMATLATAYGASQFFGVGEVADVVLGIAGVATLGASSIDVGKQLIAFFDETKNAKTEKDLERSGVLLAGAVIKVTGSIEAAVTRNPELRMEGAIDEAAMATAESGQLKRVQQFFADRIAYAQEQLHEVHVRPHTDLGKTVDNLTKHVIAESGIPKTVARFATGAAGAGAVAAAHAIATRSTAPSKPSMHDSGSQMDDGVPTIRVSDIPAGFSFKARVARENAESVEFMLPQPGIRIRISMADLLAHAQDPATLYDTLADSHAKHTTLDFSKDNGHIQLRVDRAAARSR